MRDRKSRKNVRQMRDRKTRKNVWQIREKDQEKCLANELQKDQESVRNNKKYPANTRCRRKGPVISQNYPCQQSLSSDPIKYTTRLKISSKLHRNLEQSKTAKPEKINEKQINNNWCTKPPHDRIECSYSYLPSRASTQPPTYTAFFASTQNPRQHPPSIHSTPHIPPSTHPTLHIPHTLHGEAA